MNKLYYTKHGDATNVFTCKMKEVNVFFFNFKFHETAKKSHCKILYKFCYM